jgi:hypothetical protein
MSRERTKFIILVGMLLLVLLLSGAQSGFQYNF